MTSSNPPEIDEAWEEKPGATPPSGAPIAPARPAAILRGSAKGLEVVVDASAGIEAISETLTTRLAEAPAFFRGSDVRIRVDQGPLAVGALGRLDEIAAQFDLRIVEVGAAKVDPPPRRLATDADAVPRSDLAAGTAPQSAGTAPFVAETADADAASPDADDAAAASPVAAAPSPVAAAASPVAAAPTPDADATATDADADADATDADADAGADTADAIAADAAATTSHAVAPLAPLPLETSDAQRAALDDLLAALPAIPPSAAAVAIAAPSEVAPLLDHEAIEHLPGDTRMVVGPVRSGVILEHTGHLVVMGDVNPGAEVLAAGNIIVLGRLRGIAHAGIGRDAGFIVALRLEPQQLRIGCLVARAGESDAKSPGIEIAHVTDNRIVVERYTGRLPPGLAVSI